MSSMSTMTTLGLAGSAAKQFPATSAVSTPRTYRILNLRLDRTASHIHWFGDLLFKKSTKSVLPPPHHGYNPHSMKYFYGEYDGEEFPTQDKLFGFDQLMQFILQYGDQALKALEKMLSDPNAKPENQE